MLVYAIVQSSLLVDNQRTYMLLYPLEGRQGNCLNPTQNLSDSLSEFWHFVWQNQKKKSWNQKFDFEERGYFGPQKIRIKKKSPEICLNHFFWILTLCLNCKKRKPETKSYNLTKAVILG